MHKIILFFNFLLLFGSCTTKENCYIDLGNERERVCDVPDSILKFSFFTLDKNKILLQVNDTSQYKLLLDIKNKSIANLDLTAKGFKGIYNNAYKTDTLKQQYWQNKGSEIELYDRKTDRFYYFPKTHYNEIVFLQKHTILVTRFGLKLFDNQHFTIDSIQNVPPWDYVVEKENESSIFINNDHRYNVETGVLEQVAREEVKERTSYCFSSESKEKTKKNLGNYHSSEWNNFLKVQDGLFSYKEDSKNIYALFKEKLVVWNKAFLTKDVLKINPKNEDPNIADKNQREHDAALRLNDFITFQHKIEDNHPNDILSKYKIYQICTKANREKFGNVYQFVRNPFDFGDYGYSDYYIKKLERLMQSGKCPKEHQQNAYCKLFSEYLGQYNFEKALFYFKFYKKDEKNNENVDLMKIVKSEFDTYRKNKLSGDKILFKKIELAKKIDSLSSEYEISNTLREYEWNTCQKILKKYPNSSYCDDIELAIYNGDIRQEEYEYPNKSVRKLKKIIAKYPKTNLKKEFELAMIHTYAYMSDDANSDSTSVFNNNLKGTKMLVDFYKKNPNFYHCSDNEYKEDYKTEQKLKYAIENLESLKFQQNIRVQLSATKTEYSKNEPIIVTITVKNISKDNQEIETNEITGLNHNCLIFSVLDYKTEGCVLDSVLYFQRILKKNTVSTKRTLKGGEILNFQIDITKLANLEAKSFSTFENPLKYCYYPNSFGRLQFLKPQTLLLQLGKYSIPSNCIAIKIK